MARMDMLDRSADAASDPALLACIEACGDCHRALRGFARDGARSGPGSPGERTMWRLMLDCAEVCEATATFLRAESVFIPQLAEACLHLCDECAAACEAGDPTAAMDACAAACRRCAEACFALSALVQSRKAMRGLQFA
jgi:hypothetical protein